MDMFAKRIMKEQVGPTIERMLDNGISEKELDAVKDMVCIAKELVEYDILMAKLHSMGGDKYEAGERASGMSDDPQKM